MAGRIRRVSLRDDDGGESTEYWEREWEAVDLGGALRSHLERPDPTMRLLASIVPPSGVVVEVGSGASTHLAALRSDRRTLVGIDRAGRALRASGRVWPDLLLVDGDIRQMPFRDQSVDCVISLGVVEHIEAGPAAALAEHRRILAPDGLALIAVPYVNSVRWVKDRWHLDLRRRDSYVARRRDVTTVQRPVDLEGAAFHQYEFTTRDWHRALDDAGFAVVADHRYLVSSGIGELSLARRRTRGAAGPTASPAHPGAGGTDHPDGPETPKDRARRVVLAERPENALERFVTGVAQRALGHMILTVARRR